MGELLGKLSNRRGCWMVGRWIAVLSVVAASVLTQTLPAGWSVRADRGNVAAVKFAAMGSGFHISPGDASILFREADKVDGKFHAEVSFTQTKAPQHPEAYGMFLGGKDLAGDGQKYTYFLIRGDGMYSVKKRDGAAATGVVAWTATDAIQKQDSAGKATNKIEIDAAGAKVAFKVNGKTVYEMESDRSGIVGLRVNHGLDVHIAGFGVHKM